MIDITTSNYHGHGTSTSLRITEHNIHVWENCKINDNGELAHMVNVEKTKEKEIRKRIRMYYESI